MRNPADLPPEVFDLVLNHALADCTASYLCQLSLLDRKWHRFLLPRVYGKWTYDGARHSFHYLWMFFLTVNRCPEIAGLVKTLVIGNWGFNEYEAFGREFDYDLGNEGLDTMRDAIRAVGLQSQEEEILEAVARGDRRPIMALLLTCLRNLTSLDAHVPQTDPVLSSVLRHILAQHRSWDAAGRAPLPPFAHLSSIRLWCEVFIETNLDLANGYGTSAPLRLNNVWPLIFLPALRTLGLYEVDFYGVSEMLEGEGHTSIQDLTLVCTPRSEAAFEDFQAFMGTMRGLCAFSFTFDDQRQTMGSDDDTLLVSNSDLWSILERRLESLQVLDIYRQGNLYLKQVGHLPPLTTFTQLRQLFLQPGTLLGASNRSPHSSIRLQDALPSRLQTLTFYGGNGLQEIYDLDSQIADVLLSNKFSIPQAYHQTHPLKDALHATGVVISFVRRNYYTQDIVDLSFTLPEGGTNPALWLDSYRLRLSGTKRYEATMTRLERLLESDPEPSDAEDMHFGPSTIHCLPFTDHRGTRAYMVFEAPEECPLPKLYSFAVYLTHRDLDPHDPNIADTLRAFYGAALSTDLGVGMPDIWRLDFYFLPGGADTDCTEHYRGELAVRGSFNEAIARYRETRRADPPLGPPGPPGTLPGMVNGYSMSCTSYQMLFICEDVPYPGAAVDGRDPGWVVWVVEFGWGAGRTAGELEGWERDWFGFGEDMEGDVPTGDGGGGGGGDDRGAGEEKTTTTPTRDSPPPIAKTRCTMTHDDPLWDGREVRTFGDNMFQNRHPAYDTVGEFWDKAMLRGWKNW
ncbi:hypothetical protein BJY00DRAFT_317824 [Aspergillus carlsbadensis]|nr:hypothetical protein BJY00DRAFT_317824 [Aspergillus carlsbadensis]